MFFCTHGISKKAFIISNFFKGESMKKIFVSMMMFACVISSMQASSSVSSTVSAAGSAVSSAASAVASLASSAASLAANSATVSASNVLQLAQNNPHIVAGLALFLSRPLLGLLTKAEQYSLARLAGVSVNSQQGVLNVGALCLQANTLSDEQVQENGIVSLCIALQEVQDPATSGSAHALKSLVDQEVQDEVLGNAVWALDVKANIGNVGVEGTLGLSDIVLAVLGALAVLGLQATGQVSQANVALVEALTQVELQQLASGNSLAN